MASGQRARCPAWGRTPRLGQAAVWERGSRGSWRRWGLTGPRRFSSAAGVLRDNRDLRRVEGWLRNRRPPPKAGKGVAPPGTPSSSEAESERAPLAASSRLRRPLPRSPASPQPAAPLLPSVSSPPLQSLAGLGSGQRQSEGGRRAGERG